MARRTLAGQFGKSPWWELWEQIEQIRQLRPRILEVSDVSAQLRPTRNPGPPARREEIFSALSPSQKISGGPTAHPQRPSTLDYIQVNQRRIWLNFARRPGGVSLMTRRWWGHRQNRRPTRCDLLGHRRTGPTTGNVGHVNFWHGLTGPAISQGPCVLMDQCRYGSPADPQLQLRYPGA